MSAEIFKILESMDLPEQFPEAFHTGLRKGVDSKYSALAWHAARIAPPRLWRAFCDYMVANMKPGTELTQKRFGELLKEFRVKNYKTVKYNSHVVVFECAMNCMPEDDIASLFAWIKYGFEL